jgi:transposase
MFRADRGRKHLNDKERGAIIAYSNDGKSVRFISDRLGIGVGTVSLWQTRYRDTGDITRKVGSGRPRKTTPEEEENIALAVAAKPITTAQEIAGKFKS